MLATCIVVCFAVPIKWNDGMIESAYFLIKKRKEKEIITNRFRDIWFSDKFVIYSIATDPIPEVSSSYMLWLIIITKLAR